jgi:hypothetical protein
MMQKLVVLLIVLVVFGCKNKPEKAVNSNNTLIPLENTTVEFKEKMHSFGELTAGEIVVFTFEFTNTGNSDYLIEGVYCDCGCVKVDYKKEPITAGKTGQIEIEFNTAGLFGKEFKTIEIDGNSKDLKHLAIFAEVKNEILEFKY